MKNILLLTSLLFFFVPNFPISAAISAKSIPAETIVEKPASSSLSKKEKRQQKRLAKFQQKLKKRFDKFSKKHNFEGRFSLGFIGLIVLVIGGLLILLGTAIPVLGILFIVIGAIVALVGLILLVVLSAVGVSVS